MGSSRHVFIIGDVHGELEKLVVLLQKTGLVNQELRWSGGAASIWFLGDFFDHGPGGIPVIDLVMRLQKEAQWHGGNVQSLLGNHEVALLGAYYFPGYPAQGSGHTFYSAWKRNGGQDSDLAKLTDNHIDWIVKLPLMAHIQDRLLIHADSTFYMDYGHSLEEVNQTIRSILYSDDTSEWDLLLDEFTRREFDESRPGGKQRAIQILQLFGGKQIVHGHTLISTMTTQFPQEINKPLIYADGLCVNVDGGMYLGSTGVIYEIPLFS